MCHSDEDHCAEDCVTDAFEEEESEDHDIPVASGVSVVDTPSFYVGTNFTVLPFFCEEVVSELPYVQVVTPESSSYRYGSRVLLDEDHIVDVKRMRRRHSVYTYTDIDMVDVFSM